MVFRVDFAQTVERFTDDVEQTSQAGLAHRNRDRPTGIRYHGVPRQTFGRAERQTPYPAVPYLLLDFENQALTCVFELDCAIDAR